MVTTRIVSKISPLCIFWFREFELKFPFFFFSELREFRKIIDEFINIAEAIVGDVEHEKARAIAAQNLLKSMAKQREAEQQDVQVC